MHVMLGALLVMTLASRAHADSTDSADSIDRPLEAVIGDADDSTDDDSELALKLVYYGSPATATATEDNFVHLYKKTTGKKPRRAKRDRRFVYHQYLPLSLGEIHGRKVTLHLFGVPIEASASAGRLLLLKHADGIVFIADADPKSAKRNVARIAELRSHLKSLGEDPATMPLVIQVVGTRRRGAQSIEALEQELDAQELPIFEAVPGKGIGVVDTLKALTKLALSEWLAATKSP